MLQIKIFPVNPLGTNCLLLWEDAGKACAVVDPGMFRPEEEAMVASFLTENGLEPDAVLLTHGHFDHVWGVASFVRRYGCPVYMHPDDEPVLAMHSDLLGRLMPGRKVEHFDYIPLSDGMAVDAGGARWTVIATPGHTPGGVCSTATVPFSCIRLSRVMTVCRVQPVDGSNAFVISLMVRGALSHSTSMIFHSASVQRSGMALHSLQKMW